jgi:predicted  nucleic acid-binding Zn-ribbon protein
MEMEQQLLLLVALQDVDEMIAEAGDPDRSSQMEGMGFKVVDLAQLEASRKKLAERISPPVLALYQKIAKRYGRAVVPVQDRICLGCFMALPTQHIGVDRTVQRGAMSGVETCENCGRILYWL